MAVRMKCIAALVAALSVPGIAFATTGYFSHGYGIKAKGMGGAGIALPQDSLAAAINPAGMVFVGNRLDAGLDWFRPIRGAEITGSPIPGFNGNYEGSERKNFLIPEFGYNRMLNPDMSVGVSVFGNGGMNTYYQNSPFAHPAFGGSNPGGVDLSQLFIAPTFAMKFAGNHAVGISLNFAYQQFAAQGLDGFQGFSTSPGEVTNRGRDDSTGWGVRVGYTGQITPALTLGATYQSKTRMSEFDKYRGLFAEQGDFDIPENYGVGLAWKLTPAVTLAGDVMRIMYGDVAAVGNTADCLFAGACALGASNGPGFGWQNTTVYKLGVSWAMSPSLTLRAGYTTLDQPIPNSQTFLNILAPGIVEDHLTLGATWNWTKDVEVSFAYMHAFKQTVSGAGSIPAAFGGGEANVRMYQDSLGVAVGWKM